METSKKQQMLEAKQRRRAKIMAQMSKMQQKFIETHFKEISGANDNDQQMVRPSLHHLYHIYCFT